MWNDGPAKQPWLNYFNEYELQHCCFGSDGGNDDNGSGKTDNTISGREGEDLTPDQERDAEAAAAAAAAASAAAAATDQTVDEVGSPNTGPAATDGFDISFGPDEEGKLPGDEYDPEQDFYAVTDPNTGTTSVKDGTGKDVTDEVGYNDLVDLGFFDKLDKGIQDFDKGLAKDFNAELAAKGLDAQVAVDKFGNYTYTGPDKYSAWGGALVDTAMELSPAIQLGKTINEQGGIGSFLSKAGSDFVDSIGGIFSGTPSASQTFDRVKDDGKPSLGFGEFDNPNALQTQVALSGLESLGAGTEFSAMQAAANKADKEQAELDAQIAAEYAMGLGQRAEEGYSGPSSLFSSGFDKGIDQRMGENMYTDPNKVTVTELSGSVPAPATPRADQVNVTPLSGSVTNAQLAAMQSLRQDAIAEFAMKALAKGERDAKEAEKRQAGLEDLIRGRQMTAAEEAALVNAARSKRAAGGMVYRNEGGEVEDKTKSAMELYLEKLGQPSKYTVPMVPMNTPSMAPPPDTSDPIALAEYRKNLARETMGNYLPFDAGGASSAINTFNENYYGGASNVNPYNVAQLASLYGLPRDAGTYEGIIGMLGGVRNEPPPTPPVIPDPDPELPPIIIEDDDNWSMYDDEEIDQAFAKGGGGIRDVLYRQTGGAAAPNFTTIAQPPGQLPLPDPDYRRPPPDFPVMPEPPPPEPKIIYDPVREAAAEKAFRDIQARRISELDEAPQTRAEREALQASGGFYRDEEGQVRDAQGNIQEDFGFDYVAPPEPDPYDPVNTPDTPAPEPEPEPFKLDTTPLPGGLVRNPETGEITVDPEGAKSTEWGISREIKDTGTSGEWSDFNEQEFLQQAYEKGKRYTGLGIGDLGGGWSIERTNPGSSIWNPPNSPSDYNYALKGPEKTFLPKPVTLPDMTNPIYQPMVPMMGQQLQPTGLQGLQQGMQGFGMQSPTPFGTQQPFSSGFGGFGQQPNFNTYSDIRSANSYNPAMGIK
mgnify:CR=1 FL=1